METKFNTTFNGNVNTVVSGNNNTVNTNISNIINNFNEQELKAIQEMEKANPGVLNKIMSKALEVGVDFSAQLCAELLNS